MRLVDVLGLTFLFSRIHEALGSPVMEGPYSLAKNEVHIMYIWLVIGSN